MREKKYHIALIIALFCFQQLKAQPPIIEKSPVADTIAPPNTSFIIGNIIITGNRKTKDKVILRELPFRIGEQYELKELVEKFEIARRQLVNISLFNRVIVAARNFDGNKVDITVEVKERWYLFPVPIFEPVDRNLNQWLVEQKGSLSRVNYGGKLFYSNATGWNDKLRAGFIAGYTKQFSFNYMRPYIDKKLKWGVNVGLSIGKNKEVTYNTINDKQVFVKDENNFLRRYVNTNLELSYRKAIKTRHRFGISYTIEDLKDTVIKLNPSYFKFNQNKLQYAGLYYIMTYYDLDYMPYPTKGLAAEIQVTKNGFNKNLDMWGLSVKSSRYWQLSSKTYFNLNLYGAIKLPFKQPYYNKRFLGYGDAYLQGYEYYVADGVAGGFVKTSLARQFLKFDVRLPSKKGGESYRIPFRIFAKTYGNAGYVHDPEPGKNRLSNKMLYSGGFGIDVVTFYDITLKLEYSFNQLGQNGLFLHSNSIF